MGPNDPKRTVDELSPKNSVYQEGAIKSYFTRSWQIKFIAA